MRIDAHQHFWQYNSAEYDRIDEQMSLLRRDFLPADLPPLLLENAISGCVAVPARPKLIPVPRYENARGVLCR